MCLSYYCAPTGPILTTSLVEICSPQTDTDNLYTKVLSRPVPLIFVFLGQILTLSPVEICPCRTDTDAQCTKVLQRIEICPPDSAVWCSEIEFLSSFPNCDRPFNALFTVELPLLNKPSVSVRSTRISTGQTSQYLSGVTNR